MAKHRPHICPFLIKSRLTLLRSPPRPSLFSHCKYGTLPCSALPFDTTPPSLPNSSIPQIGNSSPPFTRTLHCAKRRGGNGVGTCMWEDVGDIARISASL